MANLPKAASTRIGATKSELADATEDLKRFISFRSQGGEIDDVLKSLAGTTPGDVSAVSLALSGLQMNESTLKEIALGQEPLPADQVKDRAKDHKDVPQDTANRTEDNTISVVTVADIVSGSNLLNLLNIQNINDFHMLVNNSGRALNFSDRSSEYVAIFSNLVPTIELSKCVPYFNIRFIQETPNDSRTSMPFMTLDSFLGAKRAPAEGSKGNSIRDIPYSRIINPVVSPGGMPDSTVSGMELFQTPQTVSTAGIDTIAAYKANRGNKVLDPLQPLASIENISLDVIGTSQYLMVTQTKVDLDITLHDKSRLPELSPLVSPTIFPTVKAEIEWGWIHPDQSKFSTNPYAKFINASRGKQLYQVVNSSMSNKNSNEIQIKLQLVSLGDTAAKAVSIYTGLYVPYEMVRAKMQSVFRVMTMPGTKLPDGTTSPTQHVIGYETPVSLSNWESGDKFVKYEDYQAISSLLDGKTPNEIDVKALIKKYQDVISGILQGAEAKSLAEALQRGKTSELQGQKFETSPHITKTWGEVLLGNNANAIGKLLDNIKEIVITDAGAAQPGSINLLTLGDAIYFLYTQPLIVSGLFDEVRVVFFDFNDHAGLYGSLNIASYVLRADEVIKDVVKPKMTTQAALTGLLRIAGNPMAAQYGVKAAYNQKKSREDEARIDDGVGGSAITDSESEEIMAEFERNLAEVYAIKKGLHNVSYEPKFVPPRLRIHPEVVTIPDGDKQKNILLTFIYDEANTGKRSANLALAAVQTPSATLRLFNQASDSKDVIDVKRASDSKGKTTFTVQMDRLKAKSVLQTAYPTIKIGTEGSTVISATYSAGGNKMLTDINLIKGLKNSGGASRADTSAGIDADIFVVPTSLSITMIGMPLINRGQNYYIDFGTGTTIDNVYTVMGVKHNIKGGQFTSTITFALTMQGTIRSVTSSMQTELAQIEKYYETIKVNPADHALAGDNMESSVTLS